VDEEADDGAATSTTASGSRAAPAVGGGRQRRHRVCRQGAAGQTKQGSREKMRNERGVTGVDGKKSRGPIKKHENKHKY
jgi:hypothetical protein